MDSTAMDPGIRIRDYTPTDRPAVLRCIRELQDTERALDPRLPPGARIADTYLDELAANCARWAGRVLVAQIDDQVLGFTTIYTAVPFDSADDPAGSYALVGDLVVLAPARGRGVAKALLREAQRIARAAGARELRVNALADNAPANRLYAAAGFAPYIVTHRRLLAGE
jgi:GNAT superfamily N-acetyltransferase